MLKYDCYLMSLFYNYVSDQLIKENVSHERTDIDTERTRKIADIESGIGGVDGSGGSRLCPGAERTSYMANPCSVSKEWGRSTESRESGMSAE